MLVVVVVVEAVPSPPPPPCVLRPAAVVPAMMRALSGCQAASLLFRCACVRRRCGTSCPMWPDPEVEADAAAAARIPTERYLLAPPFLMLNWFARGRLGYWHQALTAQPQQVIAHLHYLPGVRVCVHTKKTRRRAFDIYLRRQVCTTTHCFEYLVTMSCTPPVVVAPTYTTWGR